MMPSLVIRDAASPADIEDVRALFREYQAAIGLDLSFQGFPEELARLPGRYRRPSGRLLLAVDGPRTVGCVGLRAFEGAACELKRLYVRREERGHGVARLLVATVLDEARTAGYRRVLLDTLPSMTEAAALYRSFGFVEAPPYYTNPIAGSLYLALELDARSAP
jgi:GNAT superfamily N-acetyltransferase